MRLGQPLSEICFHYQSLKGLSQISAHCQKCHKFKGDHDHKEINEWALADHMHTRDHNDENDEQWRVSTVTTAHLWWLSLVWTHQHRDHHAPSVSGITKHLIFFNWNSQCFFVLPPTHSKTDKKHDHTRIKRPGRLLLRTMKTNLLDLKICFIVHGSHSPVIDI